MRQPPNPLENLSTEELKILLKRLYVFSEKKLSRHISLRSQLAPQEIVHIAVVKILSGDRPWNPDKCPDLFMHIAGSIKSIISNEEKRKHRSLENEEFIEGMQYNTIKYSKQTAEDILISADQKEAFMSLIKEKRPKLLPIAMAMITREITKPRDLSKFLNKDIKHIYKEKENLRNLYIEFNGEKL